MLPGLRTRAVVLLGAAALALVTAASAPGGPVPTVAAPTPPMGLDSWNAVGCSAGFDEAWVRAQADALVRTGLRDAGYRDVDLDDCWAAPERDAAGRLVPDPARFPHGIAALADFVHARGLRLGVYTSAGTATCDAAGFPGSLGHETADASTFAAWGVDLVKDDDCSTAGTDAIARYTVMARALAATGRPITLVVCDKGNSRPWLWARGTATQWRTTPDVTDTWAGVADNARRTVALTGFQAPGAWNDPDMLEVGDGGLTGDEERSQVGLWAMLAAPLVIGTDLPSARPDVLALLGNRAVVAIDQDSLAAPARADPDTGDGRLVLRRPLADGSVAVSVTALDDQPATVPADVAGTDLLTGAAVVPGGSLAAHATVLVRTVAGS
ncbi:glycoside hydrolase family 27 protein [Actinomycetospora sp. C-140]